MKPLVIIPAYNEEKSIVDVVNAVIGAGYEYVVVNDGSLDKTFQCCNERGFNCINLSLNLGIGGAVQAGHKYALDHGYDVDIQFDGDGQHDVAYIPDLLTAVERGIDIAIGSRFVGDLEGFKSTVMRRVGIRWLQFLIRLRTGKTITDSTSGFRACSRRAIELFAGNYPEDYPEPESIALALASGLTVAEVPVVMHERAGGTSSIGGLSSLYYMIKVSLAVLLAGASGKRRAQ